MRVLLINPSYPISETPSPPLGPAFLAAALEEAGVEVKLLDFVVFPYDKPSLEAELADFAPDMAGLTSVTMNFENAAAVLKDIKAIDPDIKTVMGGPHVTFLARQVLDENPALDFVAVGEGEKTLVELSEAVDSGRIPRDVPGLFYRDGAGIRDSGKREFADLNSLPMPARHLLPLGRYRALGMPVSMTTSRGCPFQCIFCAGRKMVGAKFRRRDPVRVVDELEYLDSLDFHQINIADDLFTANKSHCLAICREITRRNLAPRWTSFARVDTVSPEILDAMKSAGCSAVSFGVESANRDILAAIRKKISIPQVEAAIEMCREAGVIPHVSFVLGLPGETPGTLKETLDFGEKIKKMGASHGFHVLAPFPGTEAREEAGRRYDIEILTSDWSRYDANRAVTRTPLVGPETLNEIIVEWEEKFDEWLGKIKKRRDSGEADEEEAWPLSRLEHTVVIYDMMMKRVLEKNGTWAEENGGFSEKTALEKLEERIRPFLDADPDQLRRTLTFSLEKNYLRFSRENGRVRCRWVDYL
ncbi:B12-binding domain-containing radical SAM protein [Candidatus Desulfarcum epimagneticum]|uniref:B12-binding domain-containing radical SAM protein n=1 Tax=uncultured Desulfobacteraceae bacterium TaxID=218296 RepID=A0A484HBC7_9BACT|nr:B12-binding domain-containing radical SAM protein [uncultured Desulfobacteraceae bacterium]